MANVTTETILNAFETVLQAGMSAKITALNTEYNDSVVLVTVPTANYRITPLSLRTEFPCIDIFPLSSEGEDYHEISIRNIQIYGVRVWDVGILDDPESLMRRVLRYMRAITEIIKATDNLSLNVDLCSYRGEEYENWEENEQGAYIYGGAVLFQVDQEMIVQS